MVERNTGPERPGSPEIKAVEILPNLLDPSRTTICWGIRHPQESKPSDTDTFNLDGLILTYGECVLLYGDNNREGAFRMWKERGQTSVHLSGGVGNPMTMEFNLLRSLPDSPFNERTIGNIKEGIGSSQRPPVYFDYPNAFQRLAEKNGITGSIDNITISKALEWGAPEYWEMLVDIEGKTIKLGKITSRPFVTGYGNGFIVVEKQPKFGDQEVDFTISNTTGAGGLETKLGNHLIVFLTKGEDVAKAHYIKEAKFTAEELRAKDMSVPFDLTRLDEYAGAFVKSARTVKEDFYEAFAKYNGRDITGIQFAFNTLATYRMGMTVNPYPSHMPHAFVKEGDLWKPA